MSFFVEFHKLKVQIKFITSELDISKREWEKGYQISSLAAMIESSLTPADIYQWTPFYQANRDNWFDINQGFVPGEACCPSLFMKLIPAYYKACGIETIVLTKEFELHLDACRQVWNL